MMMCVDRTLRLCVLHSSRVRRSSRSAFLDDDQDFEARKSRGLSTAQSTMAHLMTGFGIGLVWYLSGDTHG